MKTVMLTIITIGFLLASATFIADILQAPKAVRATLWVCTIACLSVMVGVVIGINLSCYE